MLINIRASYIKMQSQGCFSLLALLSPIFSRGGYCMGVAMLAFVVFGVSMSDKTLALEVGGHTSVTQKNQQKTKKNNDKSAFEKKQSDRRVEKSRERNEKLREEHRLKREKYKNLGADRDHVKDRKFIKDHTNKGLHSYKHTSKIHKDKQRLLSKSVDKQSVNAGSEIPDGAIKLLENPAFLTVFVEGKLCQRNNNNDIECSDDPAKIAAARPGSPINGSGSKIQ